MGRRAVETETVLKAMALKLLKAANSIQVRRLCHDNELYIFQRDISIAGGTHFATFLIPARATLILCLPAAACAGPRPTTNDHRRMSCDPREVASAFLSATSARSSAISCASLPSTRRSSGRN